jgi:dTDP-4-dehydrorhamnose reductase
MNCVAVRDMAKACDRIKALFLTLSTDYVFDGEKSASYLENDKPMPLQMYGITRLAGEYAALSAASDHAIVIRTCGLYGVQARSKGGISSINAFRTQRPMFLEMGAPNCFSHVHTT